MSRTPIRYKEKTSNETKTSKKEKLFSITVDDCKFDVFRGSGDGGQKKQKTSSGVRCTHEASGAVGKATDSREQSQNRKNAFLRMTETPEFKAWMEVEIDRRLGKIKTEVFENNEWVEKEPND